MLGIAVAIYVKTVVLHVYHYRYVKVVLMVHIYTIQCVYQSAL